MTAHRNGQVEHRRANPLDVLERERCPRRQLGSFHNVGWTSRDTKGFVRHMYRYSGFATANAPRAISATSKDPPPAIASLGPVLSGHARTPADSCAEVTEP